MKTSELEPEKVADPISRDVEAKAALDACDCQELYRLYQEAVDHKNKALGALSTVARHFMGSSDSPRYAEKSTDVIDAMERVALAAIDLAKIKIPDPSNPR